MRRLDQTLLTQMQISDVEIERRKHLLRFTSEDEQALASARPLVTEHIDTIVDIFYEEQTAIDEIALLIGDADTLSRLHQAQHSYVLELFRGHYDTEYVNTRLRIGMVHKRIGVEPKLYLSAVKTLRDVLFDTLSGHITDAARRKLVLDALDKLLHFDVTLVFDTYIRGLLTEVESAKNKAIQYADILEQKIAARTMELQEMSRRDGLTGVYNQRAMFEFLRQQVSVARRQKTPLSLLYLDIDDFKEVNDTKGHLAGDEVLRMIGAALLEVSRNTDFPCRNGGDEFCLILPDCTADGANRLSSALRDHFEELGGQISFSVGIAQSGPTDHLDADSLLQMADSDLYLAKSRKPAKTPIGPDEDPNPQKLAS